MSIQYSEVSKSFLLNCGEGSYAFGIYNGRPLNRWYGTALDRMEDIPTLTDIKSRRRIGNQAAPEMYDEYPGFNASIRGCEPAVKATFADDTRDLRLSYVSHTIDGENLTLVTEDPVYHLTVTLLYRLYPDCSIMERSAVIRNNGTMPVTLEIFNSAELHLPYRDDYYLTSLTGKWAEEYRITREKIRDGQTVLQTRNIFSGPDAVPFFAVDEGDATEKSGAVWFGTLLWSGTHKFVAEREVCGNVTITAGVNNYDCHIVLRPNEQWTTPVMAVGYTDGGFGQMSRHIHAYERRHVMNPVEAKRIMPVVYNAYGTFFGKINEEKILSVIEPAHKLGIEALIIDAGWAGEGETYQKGMGDWNQNKERFPSGLRKISDELHKRGMLFGLWMEPEVIHPESHVFREHPDWVFGWQSREPDLVGGMRYSLNFAIDEVRDYITAKILELVETCHIDYFKIDYNRYLYDIGTSHFASEDKKAVWIKYVENLCQCYLTVKAKYPNLLFENCAGGGMRTDLSMLRFSGRINRSDNQDPLDILKIHEGFSYFMLPKLAGGGCHISDVYTRHMNNRVSPMKYQAEIAMMGSMAIGKNLVEITGEEQTELKGYIAAYKEIRDIVHLGDIYRLASAYKKTYAAYEYLYGNRGVLFVLGASQQFMTYPEPIRLDGLNPEATYEVRDSEKVWGRYSGRALMRVGLPVKLEGDFDSKVIRFEQMEL